MAISHNFTLVCDEVRREDNGKLLVIGMYNDNNILLPQVPFVLPHLTFLMSLSSDLPGNWAIKFKLQHLETGKVLVQAHGAANFAKPGSALAPIGLGNVQFQAVGMYDFVIDIDDLKDPIITHVNVNLKIAVQG